MALQNCVPLWAALLSETARLMTGYKKKDYTMFMHNLWCGSYTIISTHTQAYIFVALQIDIILYTKILLRKRSLQSTPKNWGILVLDLLRANKFVTEKDSMKELWTKSHKNTLLMILKSKLLWKNYELHVNSLIILIIFGLVFIFEST